MMLKSLWESEVRFLLSSPAWALLPIKWFFPAPGGEWGPLQSSCDSYSEEFDLLLLSPIKAQLLTTTMAATGLGNVFSISLSCQEGKPFYPCGKKDLLAGILRLKAYLLSVKAVNM